MKRNCDIKTNLQLIVCKASELLASQFVNHFVFVNYLSLGKNKSGLHGFFNGFHMDFFFFTFKSATTLHRKIL